MPSLPDNEQPPNPRLATLVAINIVTEVLDEAEDILNIANDSGKSWRYVWHQKQDKERCYGNNEILGILDVKVNQTDINSSEIIQSENMIVTSTPQKEIEVLTILGDFTRTYNESGFIGQGDEEIPTFQRNIDVQSPSMLINRLFDMGEVEQEGTVEVFDNIPIGSDSGDFVARTIAQLLDSYVNVALNIVGGDFMNSKQQVSTKCFEETSNSSYSLLSDAFIDYTENENTTTEYVANYETVKDQCGSSTFMEKVDNEVMKEITKKEMDVYEKTFLTLNRDYEKYSEDEDILTDGTNLPMQEVELPKNKSSEELAVYSEPKVDETEEKDLIKSMKVVGTHKNSLVKRCRLQGAKLMSRIRSWWWRQRLIGKRKGCRLGICPLTPEARNRAASLLDHRKLRSPSPSRTVAWKFNTINEALIHSYNMNGFELEINSASVEKD